MVEAEPKSTQRDPGKLKAILAAALTAFAEQGFRAADVQDIANAAGVGKGTVYRYFGTKEDLFHAVADAGMQSLEDHVIGSVNPESTPLELIRRMGAAYAEFFQDKPELVEILIQERAEFRGAVPDTHLFYRQKNRGRFESILRQGITDGSFRRVNVRMTTNAFPNVLYGTVVCGVLEGETRRICSTAKHAIDLFLQGLLA